jgi:hypothetical protein
MHKLTAIVLAGLTIGFSSSSRADIVTGAGPGGGPHVKVFDATTTSELDSFLAYSAMFEGGVRVAAGDVTGDGLSDIITGVGPGAGPHVKVFDGDTGAEVRSFFAYSPSFQGGVFVAAGDVDGDTFSDIITGADAGASPHVKVFSGQTSTELRSFNAFAPSFAGGVRVAAGDVNNDGFADIIAGAGPGGGPQVSVFDGVNGNLMLNFVAYNPLFSGGVFVAAGDVDGDGLDEIVTGADAGGSPQVKVFNGQTGTELSSFFAYDLSFSGGVRVAAGDLNGDGAADIITGAGPSATGGPHVKVFDGISGSELQSFFAYNRGFDGGVYVAARTVIPEPTSTVLLMAGYVALASLRRNRFGC